MGIQSVVKSGASSVPKPRVSTFVHQDSQIKCNIAEPSSHDFFALARLNSSNQNSATFFEVSASGNNAPAPVSNRVFMVNSVAYIEASRPVWVINKESLTSILEFADNNSCAAVYACVKKDVPMFAEIIRSYNSVGFSLVPPSNASADNYVKLAFEI